MVTGTEEIDTTFVDQNLRFLHKQLHTIILVSQAIGAVEETGIPCIYISNVERKMGKILLRKTLMFQNAY